MMPARLASALPRAIVVRSRADGSSRAFRMDRLGPRDRGAMLALQEVACGPLMHPLTPDEVDGMLGSGGCVLGGFLADRLMAFLAIQFPGRSADNLGRDYGLAEEDLDRAAHLTGVLVHPDLRGNRLHRTLVETAAGSLLSPARHRYWFATVRPENVPSVRGMQSVGMRVFACHPKHDGHDRFLFVRDLWDGAPPACAAPTPGRTPESTPAQR